MARALLSGCLTLAVAASSLAAQVNWDASLREMGYLFLHISNINVVNGLNLTKEQAARLMALARQMEAVAPEPPSLRAAMPPELDGVRTAWLELRPLLLKGEPIPKELEDRVTLSRATESKAIRSTLRSVPAAINTDCVSCHMAPASAQGQPMSPGPGTKRLMDLAHMEGIYGKRGLWKLLQLSPQVEEVLTEPQRAILGGFACCLVPPQSLSDPVRAGQAEAPEKALDLLRRVRACSDAFWPMMREGILGHVDFFTAAVSPGADAARKAVARDAVAKALDRARKCSDVEFEMEKDALSKAVKQAIVPAPGEGPHKATFFLLIPGASRVYASYLKRLSTTKAE
ncbi:MAG TPA: hypothetical protein VNE39_01955 [Planctomycetota bacterium]|nr:hypothetical protein [Planctomycetota bacterium]